MRTQILELFYFVYNETMSCVFPIFIFGILAISQFVPSSIIARYDFIFLCLLGFQILLIWTKFENLQELKAVFVFHIFGLVFEIFKVSHGRWAYPDEAFFKIIDVPLYSGFMYASVASYIIQATKRLKLRYINYPKKETLYIIGAAIYSNFIANLYIQDLRTYILAIIFVVFGTSSVEFETYQRTRKMPVLVAFVLIAIFIWFAENISTYLKAWVYPHQVDVWSLVNWKIISSWFLLLIFVMSIVTAYIANSKLNGPFEDN